MAITDDWNVWISELSKTPKVIPVEMQGHGPTSNAIYLTTTSPTIWQAAQSSVATT